MADDLVVARAVRARRHRPDFERQLDDATHRNPSWAFTAGAAVSTLGDLKRWVESYTTGTLLSVEMQKERLTWVTLTPNSPVRAYGLGISTDHRGLGHTGEPPGYNACT
jgi:D-alanyl-D-alanine carboxypeptidase